MGSKDVLTATDVLLFQALRRCQLRHSMALWQLLCAHKSEQLLRLGRVRNPSPSA